MTLFDEIIAIVKRCNARAARIPQKEREAIARYFAPEGADNDRAG